VLVLILKVLHIQRCWYRYYQCYKARYVSFDIICITQSVVLLLVLRIGKDTCADLDINSVTLSCACFTLTVLQIGCDRFGIKSVTPSFVLFFTLTVLHCQLNWFWQ